MSSKYPSSTSFVCAATVSGAAESVCTVTGPRLVVKVIWDAAAPESELSPESAVSESPAQPVITVQARIRPVTAVSFFMTIFCRTPGGRLGTGPLFGLSDLDPNCELYVFEPELRRSVLAHGPKSYFGKEVE